MEKLRGFELRVEYGTVENNHSVTVVSPEGKLAPTIPEPVQTIYLYIKFPDGFTLKKTLQIYTLCHGENPSITLSPICGWGLGDCRNEEEKETAITINFPDGSLHVWPDRTILWED